MTRLGWSPRVPFPFNRKAWVSSTKVDVVRFSPVGFDAKNIPYKPLLIKPIFSLLANAEKFYQN